MAGEMAHLPLIPSFVEVIEKSRISDLLLSSGLYAVLA
jgi:hypothetical protein